MHMIVAADRGWGIGLKGKLLVTIPQDQKMFQTETMGKYVIMGRKTLESLPQKRPLAGRTNIVLSRKPGYTVKGAEVFSSVEAVLKRLEGVPTDRIYVMGGEEIYKAFLPYCDTVHVTRIDYTYKADTYFPDLDADPEWKITDESDEQVYFDLIYYYVKYERAEKFGPVPQEV